MKGRDHYPQVARKKLWTLSQVAAKRCGHYPQVVRKKLWSLGRIQVTRNQRFAHFYPLPPPPPSPCHVIFEWTPTIW